MRFLSRTGGSLPKRSPSENRFPHWRPPTFDERGMTEWGWMCQHPEKLRLGKYVDIGAFSYINAQYGVEIGESAQVGSHSSIYSVSTIDGKKGKVVIKGNAKIGSHSVVMPGVTIGENSVVGAFSFVKDDVPANSVAYGVPSRVRGRTKTRGPKDA
jgi:acetyltransferase-like isoleucine patch superfamily enzyme